MKALLVGVLAWMVAISAPGVPGSAVGVTPPGDVRADTTIADTIRVDQVLILALPDTVRGLEVARYHAVRLPAEGWLYERSFFWRPVGVAPGDYRFAVAAHLGAGEVDTVHIAVRLNAVSW